MTGYLTSLGIGLLVGVVYGIVGVRSPAPPIIALLGLLGMLAGEGLVSYLRGHPAALASILHAKTFSIVSSRGDDAARREVSASTTDGRT